MDDEGPYEQLMSRDERCVHGRSVGGRKKRWKMKSRFASVGNSSFPKPSNASAAAKAAAAAAWAAKHVYYHSIGEQARRS